MMGRPPWTLFLHHSTVSSYAARATPRARPDILGRLFNPTLASISIPLFTSPIISLSGTKQLLKTNSALGVLRWPILFSILPMVKPSAPWGTANMVVPWLTPTLLSVRAIVNRSLATFPMDMKCLLPFRTHPPSTFLAFCFPPGLGVLVRRVFTRASIRLGAADGQEKGIVLHEPGQPSLLLL